MVDAIVVGIPDDRLGQAVAAVVLPAPGASLSDAGSRDCGACASGRLQGAPADRLRRPDPSLAERQGRPGAGASTGGRRDRSRRLLTPPRHSAQDLDDGLWSGAFGEILAGLDEVRVPQGLGGFGILGHDVLHESAMCSRAAVRRLRGRAPGIPGDAGPVGQVDDLADHPVQQGQRVVTGEIHDERVELRVQADEPVGVVDGCLRLLDLLPQQIEVGARATPGEAARTRHFDDRPRQVDVLHRRAAVLQYDPGVAGRHVERRGVHRAPPSGPPAHADQRLGLQHAERLPQRGPGDAVAHDELHLRWEGVAVAKLAAHDLGPQVTGHELGRLRHTHDCRHLPCIFDSGQSYNRFDE